MIHIGDKSVGLSGTTSRSISHVSETSQASIGRGYLCHSVTLSNSSFFSYLLLLNFFLDFFVSSSFFFLCFVRYGQRDTTTTRWPPRRECQDRHYFNRIYALSISSFYSVRRWPTSRFEDLADCIGNSFLFRSETHVNLLVSKCKHSSCVVRSNGQGSTPFYLGLS